MGWATVDVGPRVAACQLRPVEGERGQQGPFQKSMTSLPPLLSRVTVPVSYDGIGNISHDGIHNISYDGICNISHGGIPNISHDGICNISHDRICNIS